MGNNKCEDHGAIKKMADDAMKLARKTWDGLTDAMNDIKWIKRLGWGTFLIALAVLGAAMTLAINSTKVLERFDAHKQMDVLKHQVINTELQDARDRSIELYRLYEQLRHNIPGTKEKISKRKNEWEKDKKPIVAVRDGVRS